VAVHIRSHDTVLTLAWQHGNPRHASNQSIAETGWLQAVLGLIPYHDITSVGDEDLYTRTLKLLVASDTSKQLLTSRMLGNTQPAQRNKTPPQPSHPPPPSMATPTPACTPACTHAQIRPSPFPPPSPLQPNTHYSCCVSNINTHLVGNAVNAVWQVAPHEV